VSAVIKSWAADRGVRGLEVAPPPPPVSDEVRRIAALELRLLEMDAQLGTLREENDQLKAEALGAWREGHAKGVEEGRKDAEDRSEALAAGLAKTAGEALAAFRDRLAALEDATGQLAAEALSRIVGDPSERKGLIRDAVRRAAAGVFAGAVVVVEVSEADFQDAEMLKAVTPADCEIRLVAALPSGACRLRLQMGEADLDLDGQVARLRALLEAETRG
jgi:flagellar biosynthesis/type III secretory pathway protein FliH